MQTLTDAPTPDLVCVQVINGWVPAPSLRLRPPGIKPSCLACIAWKQGQRLSCPWASCPLPKAKTVATSSEGCSRELEGRGQKPTPVCHPRRTKGQPALGEPRPTPGCAAHALQAPVPACISARVDLRQRPGRRTGGRDLEPDEETVGAGVRVS